MTVASKTASETPGSIAVMSGFRLPISLRTHGRRYTSATLLPTHNIDVAGSLHNTTHLTANDIIIRKPYINEEKAAKTHWTSSKL